MRHTIFYNGMWLNKIEEESLARTLNDKLELIGDDKSGLYLFDRDILNVNVVSSNENVG